MFARLTTVFVRYWSCARNDLFKYKFLLLFDLWCLFSQNYLKIYCEGRASRDELFKQCVYVNNKKRETMFFFLKIAHQKSWSKVKVKVDLDFRLEIGRQKKQLERQSICQDHTSKNLIYPELKERAERGNTQLNKIFGNKKLENEIHIANF
ncbi:hypothetical protein BpHYR1_042213 [Brachionus plicatilis]|uniref:Uncharacterized protein n=1 Tax=Brachionus plicatilis TaxID=10195 RepID=A0A3M7QCH8_BRAPC|nr:hypothetical protein BpHYR1_042213 [Brachionus plicatilis]